MKKFEVKLDISSRNGGQKLIFHVFCYNGRGGLGLNILLLINNSIKLWLVMYTKIQGLLTPMLGDVFIKHKFTKAALDKLVSFYTTFWQQSNFRPNPPHQFFGPHSYWKGPILHQIIN